MAQQVADALSDDQILSVADDPEMVALFTADERRRLSQLRPPRRLVPSRTGRFYDPEAAPRPDLGRMAERAGATLNPMTYIRALQALIDDPLGTAVSVVKSPIDMAGRAISGDFSGVVGDLAGGAVLGGVARGAKSATTRAYHSPTARAIAQRTAKPAATAAGTAVGAGIGGTLGGTLGGTVGAGLGGAVGVGIGEVLQELMARLPPNGTRRVPGYDRYMPNTSGATATAAAAGVDELATARQAIDDLVDRYMPNVSGYQPSAAGAPSTVVDPPVSTPGSPAASRTPSPARGRTDTRNPRPKGQGRASGPDEKPAAQPSVDLSPQEWAEVKKWADAGVSTDVIAQRIVSSRGFAGKKGTPSLDEVRAAVEHFNRTKRWP